MKPFRQNVLVDKMTNDIVVNHDLDKELAKEISSILLMTLSDLLNDWRRLKEPSQLKLPNFGSFSVKKRSITNAGNLVSAPSVTEAYVVGFKSGNKFKAAKYSKVRLSVKIVAKHTRMQFEYLDRIGHLEKVLEAFTNVMLQALLFNEGYTISGLGSFITKSRKNHNPLKLPDMPEHVKVLKFITIKNKEAHHGR